MRLYLATEAKNLAKAFNNKKHKQQIEPYLEEVMYLIGEAAKAGEYAVTVDPCYAGMEENMNVVLKDMGYTVIDITTTQHKKWVISWRH